MKDYELSNRRYVIGGVATFIVVVYIIRLFTLQIMSDDYKKNADSNAFLKRIDYPSRGIITDRKGRLMVYNQPAYDILVVMNEARGRLDTMEFCRTVGMTKEEFVARMDAIKDRSKNPGYSRFTQQLFMGQIPDKEFSQFREKIFRFPGFYIQKRSVRQYEYPYAAHVIGDVAEVSPSDIENDDYYQPGDYIGKLGVERRYEKQLRGEKGVQILLRDAHGQIQGRYQNGRFDRSPVPGKNLTLSIDLELQALGERLLEGKIGSIVAIEPSTGEVLCMVSSPTYDPRVMSGRNRSKNHSRLAVNPWKPLLNRSIMGLYPPGSTFKMLTVLEYMKENPNTWQDYVYNCNGSYQNGDYTIKCYHGTAHGAQNLIQAFANSCNGAFAEIGMQINSEKFRALANQMLFNSELPYTLPYNQSTFSLDGSSDDWEKLQTAIGQGKTQITPLHNLMIVSAIANGGTLMKPYMIDHVENVGGQTVKKFLPSAYGTLMSANDAQFLTHLMSQVVEIGTGSAMRGASYTVAGKTGSAEFETGKETHSWFVGFAPADKPKVAICVLAEESGSGGAVAAPIARQVLDRYFAKYGQ